MPSWKKVVTSGSNAVFNQITASGNVQLDGSLNLPQGNVFSLNGLGSGTRMYSGASGEIWFDLNGSQARLKLQQTNAIFSTNILASGNISGSSTSTGSFGHVIASRIQTSTLSGKSPLVIDADNLKLDASGTLSGSSASTASFGILKTANDFIVDSNGRVGINTTSPDYKLDVAGNIGMNEYLYHNGDSNTYLHMLDDRLILFAGGDNILDYEEDASSTLKLAGGGEADVTIGDSSTFFVGGSQGSYDHKVGIGTSTPGYALDVSGTIRALGGSIFLSGGNSVKNVNNALLLDAATSQHISLRPNNGVEAMRITSDGKVGIGNTSPGYFLDVLSTQASAFSVRKGTYGSMTLTFNGSNHPELSITDASGDTEVQLSSYRNSYIKQGNFGIGTTSPDYTLDVAGNIGVNGALIHNDDGDTYIQFATNKIGFYTGNTGNDANIQITKNLLHVSASANSLTQDILKVDNTVMNRALHLGLTDGNSSIQAKLTNGTTNTLLIQPSGSATEFGGDVSGSATSTGSFGHLVIGSDSTTFKNLSIDALTTTSAITVDETSGTSNSAVLNLLADRPSDGQDAAEIRMRNNSATSFARIVGVRGSADTYGDLQFRTRNASGLTTRLAIDQDGLVGIGTTSPANLLQVGSHVHVTSAGLVGIGLAAPESDLHISNASPAIRFTDENVSNLKHQIIGGGDAGLEFSADINDVGAGYHRFDIGGSEKMRLVESGNLGIGTSSPEHQLQISATNPILSLKGGTDKRSLIEFENDGTGFSVGHDLSDNGTHDFFIHDRENSGTRLYINSSGNVGIGTTSPTELLHLKTSSGRARLLIDGAADSVLQFAEGGTVKWQQWMEADNDELIFYNASSEAKVTFLQSGNVGIGTASPSADLHIVQSGTDTADGIRLTRDGGESFNLMVGTIGQTSAGFSIFDVTDNAVRLAIDTSGNVGIGTTNPGRKLEVSSGGADSPMIRASYDSNNYLDIKHDVINAVKSSGENLNLQTGGTTAIHIDASQKVGIGTTSPGHGQSTPISGVKLDVAGNQMLSSTSTTDSDQAKLFFFRSDGAVGGQSNIAAATQLGAIEWTGLVSADDNNSISAARIDVRANTTWNSSANRNADLHFSTVDSNTLAERMTIRYDGNVGIGTTSPSAKLHVDGDAIVTGKITAQEFHTEFVSASIMFDSGSTKFGDTNEDLHQFTGSMRIQRADDVGLKLMRGSQNVAFLGDVGSQNDGGVILYDENGALDVLIRAKDGQNSYINTTGNFGFGTSSPTQKIDVRGGLNSVHAMFSGQNGRGLLIETQVTTNNDDTVVLNAQTSTGEIAFETNSTERMRIDSSGKIGIGVDPTHNFNLRSSGNVEFRIQSTDDDARLQISSDNDEGQDSILEFLSNTSTRGSILYDHNTTANSQKMDFKVGDNAVTAMTILGNGHVGIGQAVSGHILNINAADTIVSLTETGGNSGAYIDLGRAKGTVASPSDLDEGDLELGRVRFLGRESSGMREGARIQAFTSGVWNGGDYRSHMTFSTVPNGSTSPAERLRIDSEGRIAIGYTSPSLHFEVHKTSASEVATEAAIRTNSAGGHSSMLALSANRHNTNGSHTIVTDNQFLGQLQFQGSDGNSYEIAARIHAEVDGSPEDGNVPGALVFATTEDGGSLTERMRIDDAGNVGINRTSAGYKLEVGGVILGTGGVYSYDRILAGNSTDGLPSFAFANDPDTGFRSDLSNNMRFITAGSARMVLDASGNLGIGETSPDEEMHLKGAEPKFRIENSSDSGKYFNMHLASGGGVSKLRFDSETHNNTLLVTNNNRVGIGAGAPAVNLHIESSQTDTDFTNNSVVGGSSIIISNQQSLDNTFSSLQFIAKETGGNDQSAAIVVESTSAKTFTPKLHIVQRTASNTQSSRLTIDESGKVGIGTTSPQLALHVVGDIDLEDSAPFIRMKETGNNKDMQFKLQTNGRMSLLNDNAATEVLTVLQSGAVGIGTATPAETLDVQGNIKFLTRISGSATSTGSFGRVEATKFVGDGSALTGVTSTAGAAGNQYNVQFNSDGSATGGSDNFVFNSSNNRVGIGTSSPTRKLQVNASSYTEAGGADANIHFSVANSTWSGIGLFGGSSQGGFIDFGDTDATHRGRILYSHASDYMAFNTSATEKVRITSGGLVGIGTTSPTEELMVNGDIATAANNQFVRFNSTNSGYIGANGSGETVIRAADDSNLKLLGNSGNTKVIMAASSGNVGIGISSNIQSKLHIADTANGSAVNVMYLQNLGTAADSEARLFFSSGANFARGAYIGHINTSTSGQPADLTFATSAAYGTPTERMRIDSSGNVGIGVASNDSKAKFQVESSTTSNQDYIFRNNDGTASSRLIVQSNDTGTNMQLVADHGNTFSWVGSSTGGTSRIVFPHGTNGYFEGGNFGIGTSSPGEKLDVDGDIRVRGAGGSIGGTTIGNAALIIGSTTNGIGVDANELLKKGGDLYFGVIDDDDIFFRANSSTRMFIQSGTGNVGIGAGTPTELLHVQGNIKAEGDVIAENFIVKSTVTQMTQSFSSGSTIFGDTADDTHQFTGSLLQSGNSFVMEGDTDPIIRVKDTTSSIRGFIQATNADVRIGGNDNNPVYFYSNGSQVLTLSAAGKVGIGQASPDGTLHVQSAHAGSVVAASVADDLIVENNDHSGITIMSPDDKFGTLGFGSPSDNIAAMVRYDETNKRMILGTVEGTAAGNIRFVVGNETTAAEISSAGDLQLQERLTFSGTNNSLTTGITLHSNGYLYVAGGSSGIIVGDDNTASRMQILDNSDVQFEVAGTVRFKMQTTSRISLSNNDNGNNNNTIFGKNAGLNIDNGSQYNTFIGDGVSDAAMDDAISNVGVGFNALTSLTSGDQNTALGTQALNDVNTGSDNVALGIQAAFNLTSATNNTAVGGHSMGLGIVTGGNNVAVGKSSLYKLTAGTENVAIGKDAMYDNLGGAGNTAVGTEALANNTTSGENVAIGKLSLYTNTTTGANTAVGFTALRYNAASGNTAVGHAALMNNSSGTSNVGVGLSAGLHNQTGDYNTYLGTSAGVGASGQSHTGNTGIGYKSLFDVTTANYNTALGNLAMENITTGGTNVGIGSRALGTLTTGIYNVAIGGDAMYAVPAGEAVTGVVAIGVEAAKGDSNTTTGINYSVAIGQESLKYIRTGARNVAVGYRSLSLLTAGSNNTAVGHEALYTSVDGTSNTAVGRKALYTFEGASADDGENTAVGALSALSLTTGVGNTSIGKQALCNATTAGNNVAIGLQSMGLGVATAASGYNTAVGTKSLYDLTSGTSNVALGAEAAQNLTTGVQNVVIGRQALNTATNSSNCVILGLYAGLDINNSAADGTVLVGRSAGENITSAAANTAVGYFAGSTLTTGASNVVVGYDAMRNSHLGCDKNVVIGRGALYNGEIDEAVFIGFNAGGDGTTETGANGAVGIGKGALNNLTSGGGNTAVGYTSGDAISTGYDNTALGYNALGALQTGNSNVAIGKNALDGSDNGARNVAIGNGANGVQVTTHDCVTIGHEAEVSGNGANNQIAIGKGTTAVGDNSVTLGNASVTAIYAASDRGATIYAAGLVEGSSMTLKENIAEIESPLDKLTKLRGVEFDYKSTKERSIGMIAEEVNEVFPELVNKNEDGEVTAMSYSRMTAVLLEAVKELSQEVKDSREEIRELKKLNNYSKAGDKN